MINGKKVLCVVTARKGSKGLPGKNYKNLMGKPLFLWSVESACDSLYIDKIVISSNCDNCLREFDWWKDSLLGARGRNVEWRQRPDDISSDTSKNEDAVIHAINSEEEDYDIVINLQPTSPVRRVGLIDDALEMYVVGGYDSLLTATKETPFFWRKNGKKWDYVMNENDCCERKMRQNFSEEEFVYHDNGSIYISDVQMLLESRCRIGSNPCVFEIKDENTLQIDTDFDFKLIEAILSIK